MPSSKTLPATGYNIRRTMFPGILYPEGNIVRRRLHAYVTVKVSNSTNQL